MGTLEQFPGALPAPAVMHILGRFDRITLEAFLSVAIDLLDVMDGDSDAEADDRGGETVAIVSDPDLPPEEDEGDPDLEQTRDEDDWFDHGGNGPGCPVSDPDCSVEDHPEGFDPEEDACIAGDDGCGPVYRHGYALWGAEEDRLIKTLPVYGIDQSAGPINEREAVNDHIQEGR